MSESPELSELDELRAELAALRTQITSPSVITTTVPEHGAGVGTLVAETWSQYEQELASTGLHPLQD